MTGPRATAAHCEARARDDAIEQLAHLIGLEIRDTGGVVQIVVRQSAALEPLLTVDQLCARLHVRRTFVDGLVRGDQVPHYKVGRQTLFLESEAREAFRVLDLADVRAGRDPLRARRARKARRTVSA